MKIKLLIGLLLATQLVISQNFQTVEEVNDACSTLGFAANEDAEIAVDNILDIIGVFRNFTIQECPNINNAVAKNIETESGHKERYILYDSEFFKRIDDKASNDWAAVSILAHEIAHHLNGHALNDKGSNHRFELEADYSCGYYLGRMGATLEEAQSAIKTLRYEKATSTHPAKKDRLDAVERGWSKATGKVIVKTIEEEKEITAFDYYRKGEFAYADYKFDEARNHFENAEKLGYPDANYYLSHLYYSGLGTYVDYNKAYKYAKKGYDLGSIPSTYQIGKYLANGTGTKKNIEDSNRLFQKNFQINWFKEQYKKYNTAFHAYAIGYMYSEGFGGVDRDDVLAVYWYRKAANQGDLNGMSNLGVLYNRGEGILKDYSETYKWYKKAADIGLPHAIGNLGILYRDGKGVKKNKEISKVLFEKSANKGYSDSMLNLAVYYRDEENNGQEAIKWFTKYAKINPDGYSNIGSMYFNGNCVEKNRKLAFNYFLKAANLGSAKGNSNLGYCYDEGIGVDIDWRQALNYYRKGANLGSAYGKCMLGEFYLFGVGSVYKDESKAINLFREAKKLGDEKSSVYLKVLEDIENEKYYNLSTSKFGNYFDTEENKNKDFFPVVSKKHQNNIGFKLLHKLGESYSLDIKPVMKVNEKKVNDNVWFGQYKSAFKIYDEKGENRTFIKLSTNTEEGYRGIGYIYSEATFYNEDGKVMEKLYIKIPAAICWKPKKDYEN